MKKSLRWILMPMIGLLFVLPACAQDQEAAGTTDEAADRQARPCMYDERYQHFAFWVGDWSVSNAQGQQVGTNSIQHLLGGCLMLENWTSAGGGQGKSMNYFDPASASWKQVWVAGRGGNITFEGNLRDGAMHFEGVNVKPDGSTSQMRMTFTPLEDGRVRQYIEESTDEGATWAQWFDGYYARQ